MLGRTPLLLLLTNSFSSTYVHYDIILFHFVSFCFNSQWSSPYFLVFSPLYFSQFVNHEQLISSLITPFDMWLIMITSTLLALPSWCSTNKRTSQNTCTLFNSYTGLVSLVNTKVALGLQGISLAKSWRIFSAAVCQVMYLFCSRAIQPARTWVTLHSLQITSPVVSVCMFWQAYSLVGNNCLQSWVSSNIPATVCVGHCFEPHSHQKHVYKEG